MIKKILILSLLTLSSCSYLFEPKPNPDYAIRVMPGSDGKLVAVPPSCASYAIDKTNPFDNQPDPQFGCATARNLALMVERPEDLVKGREFGDSSGVMAVGAMRRYYNNQTRGLIDPDTAPDTATAVTTSSSATSALTGDVTGGTASAAPTTTAAAP